MKRYLYDMAICAAVILAAALLLLIPRLHQNNTAPQFAEITVNGECVAVLDLDEDLIYSCESGVTVTVEAGEVYISSADCPDGLCQKRGKLSSAGESAVCLPNKTVVRICKHADEMEVDGIVG